MPSLINRPGGVWRRLLVAITIQFIMFSIAICAAAIWFFIERNYMQELMQSSLFTAASIVLFIVGLVVFFISFVGCMGAYRGVKCLLYTYFGINLFLVLLCLCGAFVAGAFNTEIQTVLRENMRSTLVQRYGNNTHNTTINRIVTEGWDRMQIRLNCCAVETKGWPVWQESSWYQYKLHNNFEIAEIPLVPESCCRRVTYDWDRIINRHTCQTTQGGPPKQSNGSPNYFLNYQGCYDAAKDTLLTMIWVLFGFGFILAFLIIAGMVAAICLARRLRQEEKRKNQMLRTPRTRRQDY